MRALEHLQLDPLNVVARAHDLMLHSRVVDYHPDDWAILTHGKRRFFEWGGWLAVRPIEELPHWRVLMRRQRDSPHWRAFAREHKAAIEEMRGVLRRRDEVSNRDFATATRTRVNSYRGRKDSAIALHYLWRIGEAMVTRRERFQRVYARTDAVIPAALLEESSDAEADEYMLRKQVAAQGLTGFLGVSNLLERPVSSAELKAWRDRRVADGDLIEVKVEGWKGPRWALGTDRVAQGQQSQVPKPSRRLLADDVRPRSGHKMCGFSGSRALHPVELAGEEVSEFTTSCTDVAGHSGRLRRRASRWVWSATWSTRSCWRAAVQQRSRGSTGSPGAGCTVWWRAIARAATRRSSRAPGDRIPVRTGPLPSSRRPSSHYGPS